MQAKCMIRIRKASLQMEKTQLLPAADDEHVFLVTAGGTQLPVVQRRV